MFPVMIYCKCNIDDVYSTHNHIGRLFRDVMDMYVMYCIF